MLTNSARSLGGIAQGIKSKKIALDNYNKNPNYCKYCNKKIEAGNTKISEVRRKSFCNHTCAAIFSNMGRKKEKIIKVRIKKGTSLNSFNFLIGKTKKEVFEKHKNWQSARTSIRRLAGYIFNSSNKPKKCNCGYDKHYEICHIKAVSSFTENCLMEEINHIDNLIALCPNCHWEFDNK